MDTTLTENIHGQLANTGSAPDDYSTTGDATPRPDDLIESDRVEGTAVYNRAGDRLGTVRRFLVEKRSGKARYAEMVFGGFLGIGEDVHPLPWDVLTYDTDRGGYVVDLSKEQLEGAPRYGMHERRDFDDAYDRELRGYYGLSPLI